MFDMKNLVVTLLLIVNQDVLGRIDPEPDWDLLSKDVQIRVFTPAGYRGIVNKRDRDEVWSRGTDLKCLINPRNLDASVIVPAGFDPNLPIRIVAPGFIMSSKDDLTNFVNVWMEQKKEKVNVILVEWSKLNRNSAFKLSIPLTFVTSVLWNGWEGDDEYSWEGDAYSQSSHNAVNVGKYVGLCVASLSTNNNAHPPPHIHSVGHSLGAHLAGNIGRSFTAGTGGRWKIARVTALDPAGPGFVDGPVFDAEPRLVREKVSIHDAEFVDVIHTHGSFEPAVTFGVKRFGDIHQLGHADFYPDGGETQNGCDNVKIPGLTHKCSHERAFQYFLHSITNPDIFPCQECTSVKSCIKTISRRNTDVPDSYMGERSVDYWNGRRKMYFTHVNKDSVWTYYDIKFRKGAVSKVLAALDGVSTTLIDFARKSAKRAYCKICIFCTRYDCSSV